MRAPLLTCCRRCCLSLPACSNEVTGELQWEGERGSEAARQHPLQNTAPCTVAAAASLAAAMHACMRAATLLPPLTTADPGDVAFEDEAGVRYWLGAGG